MGRYKTKKIKSRGIPYWRESCDNYDYVTCQCLMCKEYFAASQSSDVESWTYCPKCGIPWEGKHEENEKTYYGNPSENRTRLYPCKFVVKSQYTLGDYSEPKRIVFTTNCTKQALSSKKAHIISYAEVNKTCYPPGAITRVWIEKERI